MADSKPDNKPAPEQTVDKVVDKFNREAEKRHVETDREEVGKKR